jgi:hypothetical protein
VPAVAGEPAGGAGSATTLVLKAFPLAGQTERLEPEVLDLRYAPGRWQACIGLPDDPYKTIVGSDGGLYYDYGAQGPAAYDNGQGTFGTRVLAELQTAGRRGPRRQTLHSPRAAIVVTEQDCGKLSLRQRAWAGVSGEGGATAATLQQRTSRRVDFLWLTATNRGDSPAAGKISLEVGTRTPLRLDAARTRLIEAGQAERVFCRFSRPCLPPTKASLRCPDEPRSDSAKGAMQIEAESPLTVQRNWAQPQRVCAACFRHVMIGWNRPLVFKFPADPKAQYRVALAMIEGWHAEPGKRPLQIRVEGKTVRTIDLVKECGRNVPLVVELDAEDRDGDGAVKVGVWPVEGAEDRNTILSGLWVFAADRAPNADVIRAGGVAGVDGHRREALVGEPPGDYAGGTLRLTTSHRPLAMVDADHLPRGPKPLVLTWDLGTLAAGEAYDLLVTLPQGDQARRDPPSAAAPAALDPETEHRRAVAFWSEADLPFDRITVPDQAVQSLLDSCIRNIYQAREIKDGRPAFQVGPTCYRGTWAADGPFILEAITYLGRASEVRAGLEQQVDQDSGPGGVAFSKKSGLRLWMIRRHAQLTGDREWLERMWPRVERDVSQIIQYRKMTRDDPKQANYGLMPVGFGDGGLGGQHREYTNVYWTLAGLKAAVEMAQERHDPALPTWQAEYQDYWAAFERARNRDKLTDAAGNTYVPVTMQGEEPQLPQRGAWAFLQSIFPGRVFASDDKLMLGTVAMLDANQREGLIFGTGWIADGIWNYAASFYAHAHLWLGHGRKAAATLYAFGNHACPLLCWREEQRPVGDPPQYVGDMPHNWASAEFIRLVRHLLILERGGELHLLEGLPRAWTRPGNVTRLKAIPTSFGPISLTLQIADDGQSATIQLDPPRRERVERLVVHLEHFERQIKPVRADGKDLGEPMVEVPTDRPITVEIEFRPEER